MSIDQNSSATFVSWRLSRREWLSTEATGFLSWCFIAATTGAVVASAVRASILGAVLVVPWWLYAGGRAVRFMWALVFGLPMITLRIDSKRTLMTGEGASGFFYHWWNRITDEGAAWVLIGADGRYRLVMPKRAFDVSARAALEAATGLTLNHLAPSVATSFR